MRFPELHPQMQPLYRHPFLWVLTLLLLLLFCTGLYMRAHPPAVDPVETQASSATPESRSSTGLQALREGLTYVDVKIGTGPAPVAPRLVTIDFTLKLPDGTVLDSTQKRGLPFSYRYGTGQTLASFDEAIASMRVGGRRTITIEPQNGYVEDAPGIPKNATLIFDVHLLRVDEEGDESGSVPRDFNPLASQCRSLRTRG